MFFKVCEGRKFTYRKNWSNSLHQPVKPKAMLSILNVIISAKVMQQIQDKIHVNHQDETKKWGSVMHLDAPFSSLVLSPNNMLIGYHVDMISWDM